MRHCEEPEGDAAIYNSGLLRCSLTLAPRNDTTFNVFSFKYTLVHLDSKIRPFLAVFMATERIPYWKIC